MKFGRRLRKESTRCFPDACLDYKAIKKALKNDLAAGDAVASTFLKLLLAELTKVSSFYVQQAAVLEASLAQHVSAAAAATGPDPQQLEQLGQLRTQIRGLIKFVALNYLAVVKAIKKRNRHCKVLFGAEACGPDLHPMDLLRQEVFFTSPRLAALSTQAELLEAAAAAAVAAAAAGSASDGSGTAGDSQAAAGSEAPAAPAAASGDAAVAAAAVEVEDYQCPICLDVLRSPVVLNCTHRFCWGCVVAHCAAVTGPSNHHAAAAPEEDAASPDGQPGTSTGSSSSASSGTCCPSSASAAPAAGDASQGPSRSSSGKGLVVLEKLVAAGSGSTGGSSASAGDCFGCPVCRQPQVMSIDDLQVDPHLSTFVDELSAQLRQRASAGSSAGSSSTLTATSRSSSFGSLSSVSTVSAAAVGVSRSSSSTSVVSELVVQSADSTSSDELDDWSKYLLPRQAPCHAGRLTVLLDLDGTLISSFTPRRAPALPRSMVTHLVGVGSSLNPAGVFVVERPGLRRFLQQLASLAEVVVFTAGLEEYAAPIIDAIDPTGCITGRLYRPACQRTPHHQCVKDLLLLGRPLSRAVLVDDTPLAFLHQPECGIPVLGFRGDPDDRLLEEAVLPLIQTLAGAPDVRPLLTGRFHMRDWFKRNGYPDTLWQQQQQQAVAVKAAPPSAADAAADLTVVVEDGGLPVLRDAPSTLVFDWDKTLTEWDAGERVVSELAPELLPWLHGLESPANFIPVTNEILSEVARRGVTQAQLVTTLQHLGAELPGPSVRLLQWASQQQLPVKVVSDCNSVFIEHILAGARLAGCVGEVITNGAAFERVATVAGGGSVGLGSSGAGAGSKGGAAAFKLVIQPCQPASRGCSLCPPNLCKGAELSRLLLQRCDGKPGRGRIVFAGDGANDICPALTLGPDDVVLAKAGAALARYLAASKADPSMRQVRATACTWESHAQLAQLVKQHAAGARTTTTTTKQR